VVALLDRQSVRIGPQETRLPRRPAADQPHDARAAGRRPWLDPCGGQCLTRHKERAAITADAGAVLDTQLAQVAGDEAGGVRLLERELRVHVEVAARLAQPRLKLGRA